VKRNTEGEATAGVAQPSDGGVKKKEGGGGRWLYWP